MTTAAIRMFRFNHSDSAIDSSYLNTNEPTELAVIVSLTVFIPVVVVGSLFTLGIVVFCVIKRRREKMKKKYSRRYYVED